MGGPPLAVRFSAGLLYLVGAVLLLPGFVWIVPEAVDEIHRERRTIVIPVFGARYGAGVALLVAGMAAVSAAALLELVAHCRTIPCGRAAAARVAARELLAPRDRVAPAVDQPLVPRLAGSCCQVVGSLTILAGCVVFLPRYSQTVPPAEIMGLRAPDLGDRLFQAGSVAYFAGSVIAIRGLLPAILAARRRGQAASPQLAALAAFALFLATSALLFANGLLPKTEAVLAGRLRVTGAVCLLAGVAALFSALVSEAAGRYAGQPRPQDLGRTRSDGGAAAPGKRPPGQIEVA